MVIQKGTSCGKSVGTIIAYGSKPPLPMRGFPAGRVRIRARNDDFVLVRVRTTDGIHEYYVREVDGFWEPAFEKGFNLSNVRDHRWLPVARLMPSERSESASGVPRVAIRCIALLAPISLRQCKASNDPCIANRCNYCCNHKSQFSESARTDDPKGHRMN